MLTSLCKQLMWCKLTDERSSMRCHLSSGEPRRDHLIRHIVRLFCNKLSVLIINSLTINNTMLIVVDCLGLTYLDLGTYLGEFDFSSARQYIRVLAWNEDKACLRSLHIIFELRNMQRCPLHRQHNIIVIELVIGNNTTLSFLWASSQFRSLLV